ncbi:sulfurtransferase-like selenium metabolism protein YedF [Pseudodesulfovibrio thermohalotolerans]|uniref:sulfurtransferase-like selenium metabolism protein YedF n=1 Tax=Pseudodesulfovibrio thermohalotolerans TaxID=2880651 RepID=UPI00244168B0|nr:sulfurtransferase-like selenium metabolism protein YedF [Pseudodesulfovibrio thermohalotolerans]WFS60889.1 sulfurtransferase-like selenium metabolism protein YedF [Pseudodesulfovibrio thermohalotolerans]
MSDISIDCKGLPCPQPVLRCKETIEKDGPAKLVVVVDNDAARENVSRFLTMQGYAVQTERSGSDHIVTGQRENTAEAGTDSDECAVLAKADPKIPVSEKTLVFVPAETMGSGDDELGASLMFNFMVTLKELGDELWRIILVNGGVKLAVPGSRCFEELKKLEESGVSILVCGTCLEFFGLTDQRGVGDVTNMLDVVTSFQLATKTIRV